jgi:hypothetical protein
LWRSWQLSSFWFNLCLPSNFLFFITAINCNRNKVNLPDSRKLACPDMVECTKRPITQRDVAIINSYLHVIYMASLIGFSDYTKAIYHIDVSFTLYVAGLLSKGSPFLYGINRLLTVHGRRLLSCNGFQRRRSLNFFVHGFASSLAVVLIAAPELN